MSGIIILPIFITYLTVGYFVLKFILGLFNINVSRVKNKIIIFIIVLLFPFWDLFAQIGIKIYYQMSGRLNPIVHEMPQRDKDGKIESFDFSEWEIGINKQTLNNQIAYSYFSNGVSDFGEIYMYDSYNKNKKLVRLDLKNKKFEYIKEPTSRYLVRESKNYEYKFFGMAKISKALIIDRNKNKILMEAKSIDFTDKFYNFRRNYLLFISGGAQRDMFSVDGDSGNRKLFKRLKLLR